MTTGQSENVSADLQAALAGILGVQRFFGSSAQDAVSPVPSEEGWDGHMLRSGGAAGQPAAVHGGASAGDWHRGAAGDDVHTVFMPNTSAQEMEVLLGPDRRHARGLARRKAEESHALVMHQTVVIRAGTPRAAMHVIDAGMLACCEAPDPVAGHIPRLGNVEDSPVPSGTVDACWSVDGGAICLLLSTAYAATIYAMF